MAIYERSNATLTAGSLVRARGRDWVVLPSLEPDVLRLRPLTGNDDEATGLFLPLEGGSIAPTSFAPPDPARAGDATGGLLLRDATRLSLRSGAAPFRSLGRISVTPRPYQFVPLIMALRLDPVRLLIADDVGVGKTIEAAMIARELLDRGIVRRIGVICASHLCDQWATELREKFALQTAVVQPSRIGKLERDLPRQDLSIYQYYPNLVVSIDFVKSDRNRDHFLRNAPDLIIVDEAHMAARPRSATDRLQHQRYEFVRELAGDNGRHVILVTATPHSGIEESFRSLLGLLNPAFDAMPGSPPTDLDRKLLVPHLVQRRRNDLAHWLGTTTPFPERQPEERTYALSAPYRRLFEDILSYCRETVQSGSSLRKQQQRVRHWAAIALLRCVLSSPGAAIAVLHARAKRGGRAETADLGSEEEVDGIYRSQVLDALAEENIGDYVPTAPLEDAEPFLNETERRRLDSILQRAGNLAGAKNDLKLVEAAAIASDMLKKGFRPIIFCRFIATAKYLQEELPKILSEEYPHLQVAAVTGEVGDEERREKIQELVKAPVRVLVATDCLSEGVNLQDHFDAVLHYDLPWNPNRLEQREGRVDRFGQRKSNVRTALLYGADNPVDLVVLDVLIRKAQTIRKQLGISVPVPVESEQVVQAVVDSVLLRAPARATQLQFTFTGPEVSRFHAEWDAAADREKRLRTFFAQHAIKPDEVAREIEAADPVLGNAATVQHFLGNAVQRFRGELRPSKKDGVFDLTTGDMERQLKARCGYSSPMQITFDRMKDETAAYLGRTHPLVAALCDAILREAFSSNGNDRFGRCGAMFTNAVSLRTAAVLLRLRYMLKEKVDEFAEEVVLAAFQRRDGQLLWLEPMDFAPRDILEKAQPAGNMPQSERVEHTEWALDFLQSKVDWFEPVVSWRVRQLQESHDRLRKLIKATTLSVQPHNPPDILGCYVLVPAGGTS